MREGLTTEKLRRVYDKVARRYDRQHFLLTGGSDQRGRKLLVERAVAPGDGVLDCGAGTGSTALLAAKKAGPKGRVVLFDLSELMLDEARVKLGRSGVLDRCEFQSGDMLSLPFPGGSFDVVLSTYSLCPVVAPVSAAMELFRVLRPGGKLGLAHSTESQGRVLRWFSNRIENGAWHFPALSLGCRAVSVLPTLQKTGCQIVFQKRLGVPLWPFLVALVEKPGT
jgi:ubiquinone/menaquinone biosynthesis C-methylase UbiE